MEPRFTKGHPDAAQLHAYARKELDETDVQPIKEHLEICPLCQAAFRHVESVLRLFRPPPQLDDLNWEHVRRRVKTEIEHRHGFFGNGRRWGVAAAAAAAAIFVTMWAFSDLEILPPKKSSPAISHLVSGAEAFSVKLSSGTEIELSAKTSVKVSKPKREPYERLVLLQGEIHVRVPDEVEVSDLIRVSGPDFTVLSSSRDFSVSFVGERASLEVRQGQATFERDGQKHVIREGQELVEKNGSLVVESTKPAKESAVSSVQSKVEPEPLKLEPAIKAKPTPAPLRATEPKRVAQPTNEALPSKITEEGQTNVQVIPPPERTVDPFVARWLEASKAFYQSRDPQKAIGLAEALLAEEPGRPEAQSARELLCEAYLALNQPQKAITACSELLWDQTDEMHVRLLHQKLAMIYRTQLGDCANAIHHYSRGMVFGGTSLLDDQARLGRVECAMEIGDRERAARDLEALAPRAENAPWRLKFEHLRERLTAEVQVGLDAK